MKNYYRIVLGRKSIHAAECFAGNFIGADFGITEDLTGHLPDQWRAFNQKFIPIYQAANPGKSKIAAGLSCGFLWTVSTRCEANKSMRASENTLTNLLTPGQGCVTSLP